MLFTLSPTPINPAKLYESMVAAQAGAFNCFEGRVRDHNEGKSVVALDYEAYEPLCQSEMKKIFEETRQQFKTIDMKVAHRTGKLAIGEIAVWVGVLAAHREESFAACRYLIDGLKKRLPIWKKEYYKDGGSQWSYCAECAHERK